MAYFKKLIIGDAVASSGGRAWKKLTKEVLTSNFTLSDGSILLTADGLVFNVKEE
jgi:hypothetical protein